MRTYYKDNSITIYNGDCRAMSELLDESVQCVVTSPPYWGLRKYSGNQDLIWGGDEKCEHLWGSDIETGDNRFRAPSGSIVGANNNPEVWHGGKMLSSFCSLCGAWKGAYGLEPTPEMYVQHTVEILREIRRVLRADGVVFWNIGDSYAASPAGNKEMRAWKDEQTGKSGRYRLENYRRDLPKDFGNLKPKDLCLIPFRVAIACQEDGWWIRSVIIWNKPNPMPESVTDRPTESHEYILMLTKSARYYWDAEAVREPHSEWSQKLQEYQKQGSYHFSSPKHKNTVGGAQWIANVDLALNPAGRNLRSVWTINTQPFKGAHFATYPEKLVEICIKAGTPEAGCCSKCGAPWARIKEEDIGGTKGHSWHPHLDDLGQGNVKQQTGEEYKTYKRGKTLGWWSICLCHAEATPSIVLDPFAGSGTTLWVAKKLGRHAIGYEISEPYCQLALERNKQMVML